MNLLKNREQDTYCQSRREALKAGMFGAFALGAAAMPGAAMAARLPVPKTGAQRVKFRNLHTGESFDGVYKSAGRYLPEAFEEINHILRDFRTGDVFPVDPRIIDMMYLTHGKSGSSWPFEILSGYRSPKTNAMLMKSSAGVASNSLHMTGQAIDVRLPGISTWKLRNICKSFKAGGVGYYKKSNFVHLDTGRIRYW